MKILWRWKEGTVVAFLEFDHNISATGKTLDEAIGALVIQNPSVFMVHTEQLETLFK